MQTTTPATASPPQIQNAAEAIQALTEDAAGLAAKLGHLTAARQRCASKDVTSTLQHLALYREAVQTLQVVTHYHNLRLLPALEPCMHKATRLEFSVFVCYAGKHHSSHSTVS